MIIGGLFPHWRICLKWLIHESKLSSPSRTMSSREVPWLLLRGEIQIHPIGRRDAQGDAARAPKLMEEEENMPLRTGHRWTNDEDDDLIMLLTLHEDKQEIADMLLRTVGAINARTNLLYERGMIRIIDWRRQNRRIPGGVV